MKAKFRRAKNVELTQEDTDSIKKEESVLDKVDAFMEKNEVPAFTNDNMDREYLVLPTYLDEVTSRELGKYFHTFTLQRIWVRTLLSRVGAILREYKVELDKKKDAVYSQLPQRLSITEKELKLYNNEDTAKLLRDITEAQEKYNMLGSYMENLEDGIFNISREITRRSSDMGNEERGANINNIKGRRLK